jgi:hypothetical protein
VTDSIWGPIVSPLDVEQAVKTTLQTWVDSALTEMERQSDMWAIRQVPRPVSWEVVTDIDDIDDWPDDQLPAVVVESAGKASDPEYGPEGEVDGQFAIDVTVVYRGSGKLVDRELTRRIVVTLATAVELVLLKQPGLGGLASAAFLGAIEFDIASPTKPRTLSGAQVPVVVLVAEVANRNGLPDEPDPPAPTDPPADSPEYPDHTSTHVTVTTE